MGGSAFRQGPTPLDKIANAKSPAEVAHISEAHLTAPWHETRFHSFFLASHLPFGAAPRIANDQRHPGGRGVLFFDGHAEMMSMNQLDVGWGESLGKRLRWFSILGSDVPESFW
jgi:prepilin-type processing-associated H-X9-DG protein